VSDALLDFSFFLLFIYAYIVTDTVNLNTVALVMKYKALISSHSALMDMYVYQPVWILRGEKAERPQSCPAQHRSEKESHSQNGQLLWKENTNIRT